jgi:hypothetical protein
MKLQAITTTIFFYIGIISIFVILNGPISTGWLLALIYFFIWAIYMVRFACKTVIYKISGMKYIYEVIFGMK